MTILTITHADISCPFRPWNASLGQVFSEPFALDTETTLIDKTQPNQAPDYVLGAACDGTNGFFVTPNRLLAFLDAHQGVPVVFHNATFDLKVIQQLLGPLDPSFDVYARVEANQVWDTWLLHRIYCLATDGSACKKKGQSTLEACSERYLGCSLPKDTQDSKGNDVRTSFGRYFNQHPSDIEPIYLEYLAKDVLATILVFNKLEPLHFDTLDASHQVWGYVSPQWLDEQIDRWGPQTHHIQLKAAIALDQITANGLCVDQFYSQELNQAFEKEIQDKLATLKEEGWQPGKGSSKALQKKLEAVYLQNPGLTPIKTATGKLAAKEEVLISLAKVDPFFQTLMDYKGVQKTQSTYLAKMNKPRLHPRFDVLKNTGRTSSFGDINAQNLPRDDRIRRCFVPSEGHYFLDADYSTIEMVTLAQSVISQFGLESQMANAINDGKDLHRLVAAKVTDKPEDQVTKEERSKAKPINFGKPGGMGTPALQRYAAESYGVALSMEEVEDFEQAWFELFPEMEEFLAKETDLGEKLAVLLGLTKEGLYQAQGKNYGNSFGTESIGWLGGMCLKVLRDAQPTTGDGRLYSDEEQAYFWEKAQSLVSELPEKWAESLAARKPSEGLWKAVKKLLDQAGVFTCTGRLRAKASYTARHNTVFQGLAADGAKLALWNLWRAGFRMVNFIHDQVLIEVPIEANRPIVAQEVEGIMVDSMTEVVPDVNVKVDSAYRQRWSKEKVDQVLIEELKTPSKEPVSSKAKKDLKRKLVTR